MTCRGCGTVARAVILAAGAALLAGCAYPTRNVAIDPGGPLGGMNQAAGYRGPNVFPNGQPGHEGTLVIVAASGGGIRATALTLAVLEAMDTIVLTSGSTLARDIDIISSVSGGSVAAAYFALKGPAGFASLRKNFIDVDIQKRLIWRELNPFGLAANSTPARERIDPLIDAFDETLFQGKTFADLMDGQRRPFLILNAADMVAGAPFALVQDNFDLLCSDLTPFKLSTAVAASAAFPVALSAVTLKNYSGKDCLAAKDVPHRAWPPGWATEAAASSWHDNPEHVAQARLALAYAHGAPKLFIHLLDGGIADNLGVSEPLRMLTTKDRSTEIMPLIQDGAIRRIVFILINARSQPESDLDPSQATPGPLSSLLATISAGIDGTSSGNLHKLQTALRIELRALSELLADDRETSQRLEQLLQNTAFVSVDFDAIPDEACRQRFHNVSTSWHLPKPLIDSVMTMGKALFASSDAFNEALKMTGGRKTQQLPTVAEACGGPALATD